MLDHLENLLAISYGMILESHLLTISIGTFLRFRFDLPSLVTIFALWNALNLSSPSNNTFSGSAIDQVLIQLTG